MVPTTHPDSFGPQDVVNRPTVFRVLERPLKDLKPSQWLRLQAEWIEEQGSRPQAMDHDAWFPFVALTYPPEDETYAPLDWDRTIVLRWLLAAAIAESDGQ